MQTPVAFASARDHGLWTCLTVIGGAYAIDAAGQVYGLAEHQPQPVCLSLADPWCWAVLIRLSREPVFADLRPARPETAVTCSACAGAGEVSVSAQARLGCG